MEMQYLRYAIVVDALFLVCLTWRTIADPIGAMFANPLLTKEAANIPEVRVLQAVAFLMLFLIRFHTVLNIHSKDAYRLTLWSLILEFLTMICFSVHVRNNTIAETFTNKRLFVPFGIVIGLFIWMNISYRHYLITDKKSGKDSGKKAK